MPSLFYESWEYKTNGQVVEYPPLVLDTDEEALIIKNAIPMIRGITATNASNNTMYTYMKSAFEHADIRLLLPSTEVDDDYKKDILSVEEYSMFAQTDLLLQELSNIKQISTEHLNIVYERIVPKQKRDRATSLAYGLSYIYNLEEVNRKGNTGGDYDYIFSYS